MENFYKRFCKEGFDENGVLSSFEPIYAPNFNFAYDVVDEIARMDPNRKALVWCNEHGDEKIFTYNDIKENSNRAANMFRNNGIKKGDRVMLILKRHYEFWFAIIALHKLGAIGIPGTNLLTVKDLIYRFEAAQVNAVVCTAQGDVSEFVDKACESYSGIKSKFIVKGIRKGWTDFSKELNESSNEIDRVKTRADDEMLLYFTSGTTGYPKMVVHNFAYPIGHIITAKHWHNVEADGLHLTVSETGWAKSVWGKLYGQWFACAAVFVYDFDKFVPSDLLKMIEKYKITTFCAPPTIYRFFIKEDLSLYNLSSLKYATTAGEALNPEVFNKFYNFTGLKLMEGFGQTETTLQMANFVGSKPKIGSMGKPSPIYDIDLVDENSNSVDTGEVGEIIIRVKEQQVGIFAGYYKNEATTKEVWHDGIYYTRDTAWRDEDGFYWYVGRTDDVIKASGYRIGPFEIESVLMEHPSVLECAVTGAPDHVRGTVVKATIVLSKGYEASDDLKKELQTYVKKQTAPYKYPRIVEFASELPKTISGKIRRVELRGEKS